MTTLCDSLTYEPKELSFGTSGLRGLVSDMTDLECFINTTGFLKFLEAHDGLQPGATVYIAGDLRDSTPRILGAVQAAIEATGYQVVYLGLIPTPALALHSISHRAPGIMVTGSHIPADRNGIKFNKLEGEVLKEDELAIKESVAAVRVELYGGDVEQSDFDTAGMLKQPSVVPAEDSSAATEFLHRFTRVFGPDTFKGKQIVFYQHSAVGRDLITKIFEALGATVIPYGRSDVFIPIDSENVTPANKALFRQIATEHPGTFAIVSTDGDSDRPFVIDERGEFHWGDVLGAVVATWLGADYAGFTANTNDAAQTYLTEHGIPFERCKLGSPYVITLMANAHKNGRQRPVGWEVNGGFMTGVDFTIKGQMLSALPTRDATFPILIALMAASEAGIAVSELFGRLPQRFNAGSLIDNFPAEISKQIIQRFSTDTPEVRAEIERYFSPEHGFGSVQSIDTLDGVRVTFSNGDVAHMRASGNAPQFRLYSVADSPERAEQIVALAIAEPNGIFRQMEAALKGK